MYCLSVLLSSGSGTLTWTAVFTRLTKETRTERLRIARKDYYEGEMIDELFSLPTKAGGVLLSYVVKVYVGVFLLADHQNITL